jgi:hypothetical protein
MVLSTIAKPCAGQYLPNVTGTTRSPVDIPQTNLTPVTPPSFASPTYSPPSPTFSSPPPSSYTPPPYSAPVYTPPSAQPTFAPPPAALGTPLFDPYSTGATPGTFTPAMQGAAPVSSPQFPGWLPGASSNQSPGTFGGMFGAAPASAPAPFGAGNPGFGPSPYGSPGLSAPTFPPEAYPAGSPNTLFPGGLFTGGSFAGASGGSYNPVRLFQGPRLRHAWINDGNGGEDVEINSTDASLVFAFPNFLYSTQPIYIVPSFGLHLLDGPNESKGNDLPAQLYDAFVDFGWQSDPNQMIGADLGLRVGVFSDFESTSEDSIRVLGKAIFKFRLTPYSTVKAGVYYIDRNDVDWVPAFGLLYIPTPNTRYDLFFPQPKLSHYFTTLGTQDLWAFVAAEYGGGAWTITRSNGDEEDIDINDIRVTLGVEWGRSDIIRNGSRTGFAEIGYVFNREVIYSRSGKSFEPDDSFMFRLGVGY